MLTTSLLGLALALTPAPTAEPAAAPQLTPELPSFTAPSFTAPSFALKSTAPPRMKRPMLAAGLNFFLPGTGYIYNGEKPLYVSLPILAGVVGLTYVEQFHQFEGGSLSEQDPMAFGVMFGAVLVMNTGMAIDAFREARDINARNSAEAGSVSMRLSPSAFAGEESAAYGLTLDARF